MVTFSHGLAAQPFPRHTDDRRNENVTGVVVGYDASPEADLALLWAAAEAVRRRTDLRVVVVAEPLDPVMTPEWPQTWLTDATDRAQVVLDRPGLVRPDPDQCTFEHRIGPVVATLVDAAADASLLVVGSNGHTMVSRVLMGSVSQGASRRAHCPVVVVRQAATADAGRIVVGDDGKELSQHAVDFACREGSLTGHSVTLLRAHRISANVPIDQRGNVPPALSAALQSEEDELSARVEAVRSKWPELTVDGELIVTSAGDALVEASRSAAMVVVGARSAHPVVETVVGSVSRQVLQHAECPVAVVR